MPARPACAKVFYLRSGFDERAGDGIGDALQRIPKHIHLHDRGAVDLSAAGFIPVVLGILHYSTTPEIPVVQNPENH